MSGNQTCKIILGQAAAIKAQVEMERADKERAAKEHADKEDTRVRKDQDAERTQQDNDEEDTQGDMVPSDAETDVVAVAPRRSVTVIKRVSSVQTLTHSSLNIIITEKSSVHERQAKSPQCHPKRHMHQTGSPLLPH
jgi:transcriptional regulator of heat shock response